MMGIKSKKCFVVLLPMKVDIDGNGSLRTFNGLHCTSWVSVY